MYDAGCYIVLNVACDYVVNNGGLRRITVTNHFLVIITVMTLLFQKSNCCSIFITFLEVLKLLIQ